jgi:PAS domain S-box-containing protein/diguanylate cyclase (GGDEF)-like protein
MPHIIIERTEASLFDRFRSYKVVINGEVRGSIKQNEKWAYVVPPGTHVVSFRIDHYRSAPLKVAVINRTRLVCRSSFWHAFGMLAMLGSNDWVTIREEDETLELERVQPADAVPAQPTRTAPDRAGSRASGRPKPVTGVALRLAGPREDAATQARRMLEIDLREAVLTWALDLRYEPQVDLQSARVVAFEALLRWHHPVRGTIPTGQFMALAWELGLKTAISQQVLERACHEAATWPEGIHVAVNLSERQLADAALPRIVEVALNKAGLNPARLELEISEAVLTSGGAAALAALEALRQTGAALVVDAFGGGKTLLAEIPHLSFTKLKISRQVISGQDPEQNQLAVIRAALALCRANEMTCCACGVETQLQVATLQGEGCAQAQGRLYGPLVSAREILPAIANINHGPQEPASTHPSPAILPFVQIADMTNDMLMVTDTDLGRNGPKIVYVNRTFTRVTGYSPEEAIGRSPTFLQGPLTSIETRARIRAGLRDHATVRERVLNFDKTGAPFWVDLKIVPIRSEAGTVTHFASIQRDVTAGKRRFDELEWREDRDVLTGISNRRAILRAIETSIAAAQPHRNSGAEAQALSVAFIDVDQFAATLESGEKVAQALLLGVADRLADNVRRCDMLGRIADGMFAVCMPALALHAAEIFAERLRQAVASAPFDTPHGPMAASVTVAVVECATGDTIAAVLKRIEAAIRAAKEKAPSHDWARGIA